MENEAVLNMCGGVLSPAAIWVAIGIGVALGKKPKIRNFVNPRYSATELRHLENLYEWYGI